MLVATGITGVVVAGPPDGPDMRVAPMINPTNRGRIAMIRIPITRLLDFFPSGAGIRGDGGDSGSAGAGSRAGAAGNSVGENAGHTT